MGHRFVMVKMAKRPFEELIELLEHELDDRLRVVLRIDSAGVERLFARDDLALQSDDELGRSFVRNLPAAREPAELLPGGGDGPDCLVGFTAETVELLLYRNPLEAVAVAYDRSDEGAFGAFVGRCLAVMQ